MSRTPKASLHLEVPARPLRSRVWVAYSGGLDSTVLLHRLAATGTAGLRAVHVHHGLQIAADDWLRQARRTCRSLAVPLTVRRVQIPADNAAGPEAAARAARYEAMQALLKPGDLLATAHHREDQAETVLLRALRGSGIAGLAAMRDLQPFGAGQLWRPLLAMPRASLHRYAEAQGLQWIDDPHNQDSRYARSHLRASVWPLLLSHWPQAAESLSRLAAHARDAEMLLNELAALDQATLGESAALSVSQLLALSAPRRRNLLRQLWGQRGWLAPSADLVQRLEREVLRARADADPCLRFADGEARRYRDGLYLMAPLPAPPALELAWQRSRSLALPPGCGRLRAAKAPPQPLSIRFARGGERLRPAGAAHHRSLKQLCQTHAVPVWVRVRMPLLYEGETLVSVAGLWNDARLLSWGWRPRWECDLPGLPTI